MSLSSPILNVAGLTKRYGRLTALDDVSFSVRRGEIVGLIGPNGAGKTTLFECLAGVLPRDAGTVTGDDRPIVVGHSPLFYLPDAIGPWPTQTVNWALDFTLGFFGGRTGDRPAVTTALGLDGFLDQPIGTLSKGQRKRATLAIGLLTPHPMLVIDEPFDGLDLKQTRDVAQTLRAHATGGRTLLLSIHQIADAARVCDRFVLLSGGRVRGEGTLEELKREAGRRAPGVSLAEADGAPGASPAEAEGEGGLEEVFLALT
jgi:ABC-2 type transport system ATP-binding protein